MPVRDEKLAALRAAHALNPAPETVRDQAFTSGDPFFDPRDLVQVKYEMLRRVAREAVEDLLSKYAENDDPLFPANAGPPDTTNETDLTRNTEIGAHFTRPLGPHASLEALALRQTGRYAVDQIFTVDGDTARGEIYCLVFHTFAGPEQDIDVIIGGRYLDTYTKHDGRWKFSQRTIMADWAYQNDPSRVNFEHPSTRGSLRGKRGQADPSIGLFTAP